MIPIVDGSSKQIQPLRTGVGHINTDIYQGFPQPEQAELRPSHLAAAKEEDGQKHGEEELQDCTAQEAEHLAAEDEDFMPRFVGDEIDVFQEVPMKADPVSSAGQKTQGTNGDKKRKETIIKVCSRKSS